MKKLYSIIVTVMFTALLCAQSPEKISYQAQIRNANGQLVTNQVNMKISILQISTTGTAVYEETQTPTPNSNGLISIQIGGGAVVNGTFANIDWAAGPYFVKTETDPTGGNDYTTIAISQLLNVPYALYAKDVVGKSGKHYVGELYGGGVVCWVDRTGEHGRICGMIDLSSASAFSNIIDQFAGGASDWDGLSNSNAIVTQSGHTSSAAKICLDYSNVDYGTGVYDDWYLPSKGEMNDLWNNLQFVQKTLDSDNNLATKAFVVHTSFYWTSTEPTTLHGVVWQFMYGYASNNGKKNAGIVRPMRAF